MVFKSDRQRKAVMAKLNQGNTKSDIRPTIMFKKTLTNEQRGKVLARDFIIKNPTASKPKVIKFLRSRGIVIKGNPNGIARFIGRFKEKITQLNIPQKAGKVKTFLQNVGTSIGALQLEAEQRREERFQQRLKLIERQKQEIQLREQESRLRVLRQSS